MAETIDLEVYLGMNSDELQAELQKAQNELRQFKSQLKRSTDTKEIQELNQKIANTEGTINTLNNALGKTPKKTADATQAIVNLSRVAQDAPYGFMGIANNLNPLLESFQQLSAKSKDSGGALKALVAGLMGPAGIGLALGVVSSILVKFGDDIQKFITEKAVGLGKAFTREMEVISKGAEGFVKAQVEISNLNNEFSRYTSGVSTKEEFLKKFNSTLGDTIKETKDLAVAERFLTDYAPKYVEMTFKKAIANEAATQAAKRQVEAEIAKNKPSEAFKGIGDFTTLFFGGTVQSIKEVSKRRQNTLINEANTDVKILEKIKDKYNQEANDIDAALRKIFGGPDIKTRDVKTKEIKKKDVKTKDIKNRRESVDNSYYENLKSENNLILEEIRRRAELGKTATYILQKTAQEQVNAEKKRQSDIAAFGKGKMTGDFGESLAGKTSAFYEAQKKIAEQKGLDIQLTKQQTEAYFKMADTISTYATDAVMGLFNALQNGIGIGEAVANMFIDLAKQIAAAAIKAAIFQSIIAAFSGGGTAGVAAANATTGGFTSLFKGFLGLASGGIVTKPTLAMVGEGNESEAVMPLSKLSGFLNTSFNAGAMSGTSQNGGQFVLKGSDLVLALQRSNNNLNLRRGV